MALYSYKAKASCEIKFDALCAADAKARFDANRAQGKGYDRQRSESASRAIVRPYSRVRVDSGGSSVNFPPDPTADVNKHHRSKSADRESNARSTSVGTPILFPDEDDGEMGDPGIRKNELSGDEDDGSMTEAEREKTTSCSGLFSFSPTSPPRAQKRSVSRGSGRSIDLKITSRSKSTLSAYDFDSEADSDAPETTTLKRPWQKSGAVGPEFERAAANKSTSADRLRKTASRTELDDAGQESANIVDLSSDDDTPPPLRNTQPKPQFSKLSTKSRVKTSNQPTIDSWLAPKVKSQQVATESRGDSLRLKAGGGISKQSSASGRAKSGKPAHVKPKTKVDAGRKMVKGRVRLVGKNQERPTVRLAVLDSASSQESPFGRRSLLDAKGHGLEEEMDDEAEFGDSENDPINNPTKKFLNPVRNAAPKSRYPPVATLVPNEGVQKRRRLLSSTDQQAYVAGFAEVERSSQEERREELLKKAAERTPKKGNNVDVSIYARMTKQNHLKSESPEKRDSRKMAAALTNVAFSVRAKQPRVVQKSVPETKKKLVDARKEKEEAMLATIVVGSSGGSNASSTLAAEAFMDDCDGESLANRLKRIAADAKANARKPKKHRNPLKRGEELIKQNAASSPIDIEPFDENELLFSPVFKAKRKQTVKEDSRSVEERLADFLGGRDFFALNPFAQDEEELNRYREQMDKEISSIRRMREYTAEQLNYLVRLEFREVLLGMATGEVESERTDIFTSNSASERSKLQYAVPSGYFSEHQLFFVAQLLERLFREEHNFNRLPAEITGYGLLNYVVNVACAEFIVTLYQRLHNLESRQAANDAALENHLKEAEEEETD